MKSASNKKMWKNMKKTLLLSFIREKTATAFKKANGGSLSKFYKTLDDENVFDEDEIFGVQAIEQKIKEILTKNKLIKTLKEFIKIAVERKQKRDAKVNSKVLIQEYIDKKDWRINVNANTGYSDADMINNMAGKPIANYWPDNIYSEEEASARGDGDYHMHDLDYCNKRTQVWTEVMGYYRPVDSFDIGKKGERMKRVMFRAAGCC
ncbi:MAG: hypothetical protein LBB09_01365 [Rickettsiales bacterium]|jgi:anaerobic ribonucleoside-triphosphate reductase|nr:hypothetical protein [Rickettsiales bacterium]